jgi:hypothetical protein
MLKFAKHHWLLIAVLILAYVYRQRLLSLAASAKASLSNVLSSGLVASIPQPAAYKDGGTANKTSTTTNQPDVITKIVHDVDTNAARIKSNIGRAWGGVPRFPANGYLKM